MLLDLAEGFAGVVQVVVMDLQSSLKLPEVLDNLYNSLDLSD